MTQEEAALPDNDWTPCPICRNPVLYGYVILHAAPEILQQMVVAINEGDVRNASGERITVQIEAKDADNHTTLRFTSHAFEMWPRR